jgi:IclR family transcriptional regulator, KDG regulon repressor
MTGERVPVRARPRTRREQPAKRGPDYTIAVLTKTLDLLDVLEAHRALSLTELSGQAGVNKITAFRILANLEQRGYVERDGATGQYRLGVRLMQLGSRMSEGLDLRRVARPILESLLVEFNETVNLAVPKGNGIVYIDILQSARGLRMSASVGAQDDLHTTSLGKAMLAFWPEPEVEAFLGRGRLRQKTANTIVGPAALKRELARTRERGYAVDDEENEVGARCVGAPVFDHRAAVVGAISISGPASRLTFDRVGVVAVSLVAASQDISVRMGYQVPDGFVGGR